MTLPTHILAGLLIGKRGLQIDLLFNYIRCQFSNPDLQFHIVETQQHIEDYILRYDPLIDM